MNIKQLLDRFMAGETSLDEERQIAQYFRDHRQVEAELEPYREMFDYFAEGMPLEQERKPTKLPWTWVAAAVATAAAVALLLLLSPFNRTDTAIDNQLAHLAPPVIELKTTTEICEPTISQPAKEQRKTVKPTKRQVARATGKASADSLVREIEMRQENALREVIRQELKQDFIVTCIEQGGSEANQPSNYIEL